MNNDDNLDLLDLTDDADTADSLPDAAPFVAPRPKKPWLLLGVGLLVIILATYIIIRAVSSDSSSSMEIDLDAPAVIVEGEGVAVPPMEAPTEPVAVKDVPEVKPVAVQPVAQPEVAKPVQPKVVPAEKVVPAQEKAGVPVRVIEDKKEVTFNPERQTAKKEAAKPAAKKVVKQQTTKKVATKQQAAPKGSWYVQFGSYSTRALAENAQKQLTAKHSSLFAGKQFVILAAVLPNGNTTYRLRIAFANSAEANGFCQNAKSDGLDCYVAK